MSAATLFRPRNDPDWVDRPFIGRTAPVVDLIIRIRALRLVKARFRVAQLGNATLVCSTLVEGHDRHAEPFVCRLSSPAARDRQLIWLHDRERADCRLRWIAPAFLIRLERPGDYPEPSVEILPPPADGLFGAVSR